MLLQQFVSSCELRKSFSKYRKQTNNKKSQKCVYVWIRMSVLGDFATLCFIFLSFVWKVENQHGYCQG